MPVIQRYEDKELLYYDEETGEVFNNIPNVSLKSFEELNRMLLHLSDGENLGEFLAEVFEMKSKHKMKRSYRQ